MKAILLGGRLDGVSLELPRPYDSITVQVQRLPPLTEDGVPLTEEGEKVEGERNYRFSYVDGDRAFYVPVPAP